MYGLGYQRTWFYVKAYFDYAFLAPPVVTLGESLAYGEWGHIEDPNNINSGIGVTETDLLLVQSANERWRPDFYG